MVHPYIKKITTRLCPSISYEEILVAIKVLVTGQSYKDLKFPTRISPQYLGQIISETSNNIFIEVNIIIFLFPVVYLPTALHVYLCCTTKYKGRAWKEERNIKNKEWKRNESIMDHSKSAVSIIMACTLYSIYQFILRRTLKENILKHGKTNNINKHFFFITD